MWKLRGVHLRESDAETVDVMLYAANSPQEFVALLGPETEPHPHGVLLDLRDAVGARYAALLGVLAYLPPALEPAKIQYALEEVAQGFSYAPEPHGGVFHQVREEHQVLSPQDKKILRLTGQGYSQAQMAGELEISRTTLQRCIRTIKRGMGLGPRVPLAVAVERLGFGLVEPRADPAAG